MTVALDYQDTVAEAEQYAGDLADAVHGGLGREAQGMFGE